MLYLLGIPLAIAGAKILHDDIKYTAMGLRIDNASIDLDTQYRQIEENFEDILQYSGAQCKIKKRTFDRYDISDIQKGQYGGMERYLAEKGFYPEAINYAKKLFDDLADEETLIKHQERDNRIDFYEKRLITEKCSDRVITIRFNKFTCNKPSFLIEKDVEKLIDYFHAHDNENVYCNIIMEDDIYWNHKEVWHIKEPFSQNAEKYYKDVYDKIIINNYPISKTDKLHESNEEPTKINQIKQENKSKYIRYAMSYYDDGEYEEAEKYFKKVLDIDPDFTTALIKLGYCLKNLKRYEEAITYLERVKYPYYQYVIPQIEDCRIKLKESASSSMDNTLPNSTKNGLHRANNSKHVPNSSRRVNIEDTPKTEMNHTLKHIVDEFKICPDINIVSKKVGIPAKKIKKWYNKKNGEYKLFHDAIADLNPNMTIKTQNTTDSSSIDNQINLLIKSFKEYKDIKLVSKDTGINEDQIRVWLELGRGGAIPYNYLYRIYKRHVN